MQTITDRLLASVGSERVFQDCGIDLSLLRGAREGSIPCPLHREQRGESLSLDLDRGLWHCFGSCQAGGDLVMLYGRTKGIDPGPALYKAVEEQYLGNGHARPNLPVPTKPELPRVHPALSDVVESAFARCKVIPGVPELYEVRSYSTERASGLVFMIRDPRTGKACDLKRRQIRPKPEPRFKSVSMVPWCLKCDRSAPRSSECLKDHPGDVVRAKAGLFGYRAVTTKEGRPLLCAGEKDALAGAQAFLPHGIVPCSWSAGEGSNPDGIEAVLKEVALLYDFDEAGRKATPERIAHLRSVGVKAAEVPWVLMHPPLKDGEKDLFDWLSHKPFLADACAAILGLRCHLGEPEPPEDRPPLPEAPKGPPVPTEGGAPANPDIDADQPDDIAQQYLMFRCSKDGELTLRFWRGDFYRWNGVCYEPFEQELFRAPLVDFLASGGVKSKRNLQESIVYYMKGRCVIPAPQEPPFWCGAASIDQPTSDLIPFSNGMLDPAREELFPHTPAYFQTFGLPFPFDPKAPQPVEWLRFLCSVWPDDPQNIVLLQEIFGYLLTPETRYEKMFLFQGAKRGGKGTITKILHHILGHQHYCSPSLSDLTSPFGQETLIGKSVAVFEEASEEKGANQAAAADVLKRITGQDAMSINRKHKGAWTGRLRCRIILVANEIPKLIDYSSALSYRIVPLRFTQDFSVGQREDPYLIDKLRPEATGIINWALEGRARLKARGRFLMGRDSLALHNEIEATTNKMRPFIKEYLELGDNLSVNSAELYRFYRGWSERQGLGKSSFPGFIAHLRASIPGVSEEKGVLRGLGLLPDAMDRQYPDRDQAFPYRD